MSAGSSSCGKQNYYAMILLVTKPSRPFRLSIRPFRLSIRFKRKTARNKLFFCAFLIIQYIKNSKPKSSSALNFPKWKYHKWPLISKIHKLTFFDFAPRNLCPLFLSSSWAHCQVKMETSIKRLDRLILLIIKWKN